MKRRSQRFSRRSSTYINLHLRGKVHQLRLVRRLLIVWTSIFGIAAVGLVMQTSAQIHLSQRLVPQSGGTYTEAAVGNVTILNPILPDDSPSADMNRLVFSGLTQFDAQRHIVPDLAKSWDISADGKTYTFHLRQGITWHDGINFTADDVAFTLAAIQDPDTRSPLAPSWQGVKTLVKDANTIVYILPEPLSSFLDSTTVGILPRHILGTIDPTTMRENNFNQHPVGTGPFKIKAFSPSAREVTLTVNKDYYGGAPKLDSVAFYLYDTPADALTAYTKHQVLGVGRIEAAQVGEARNLRILTLHELSLPQEQTLFFRLGDAMISDATLRSILARSVDRQAILRAATGGEGTTVRQPILPGQLGYSNDGAPDILSTTAANDALEAAGWHKGSDGLRRKDSKTLTLSLVTLSGSELERAAENLKSQWHTLGITLNINVTSLTELEQSYIRPRHYQLLLYGVSIGADPDVYAYWHSSQAADPGLNLSEYKSITADRALEAGRILTDSATRAAKYKTFLSSWDSDLPAVVLYEPSYLYAQDQSVMGFAANRLVTPTDRFYGVQNWTVRQRWVSR